MIKAVTVAISVSMMLNTVALSAECGMTLGWDHRGENHAPLANIYKADKGIPSIFYRADMDINTDGGPRSYHPLDPQGKTKALNNIVNAISGIYDRYGGKWIGCKPKRGECFDKYIEVFEEARDAKFDPAAKTRWVMTDGMIPWKRDEKLKRAVPCVVQSGPYKGYFVSQTAYRLRNGDECDPDIYLDSVKINSNVLPEYTHWESQGTVTDGFDLVVVISPDNRIVFGINGDRGPATSIGEVSVALAAEMKNAKMKGDETYDQVKGLTLDEVSYLIFPKIDVKRLKGAAFTQSDIDTIGADAFKQWGGLQRLDGCRKSLKLKSDQ
ncbi:glycoside hydrolase family 75 protein [Rhizobium ruizarguesonis]|uniref:glycoside hydrolase family 75 protein n=1 Tax=Rhizobium ruizarguesonis TaxID=2081791 RepID=UPI0010313414|nr:glycoside hydrolase family 75 protein [Rhizobium ruizarguesonis]TBC68297.1 hypothetical protein ELH28_38450 [Rhizobium ruizarguesonis]TBD93666.1 hypothetical protein ELH10_35030 [Rhizobium ruizarguesonis]TBF03665.1 hypothetical protein ELG95_32750 [Rhizobium ruizarguesonis]